MAATARHQISPPSTVPTAQAVPTETGTTAAGNVRGRAPATQTFGGTPSMGQSLARPPPRPRTQPTHPVGEDGAAGLSGCKAGVVRELVAIDLEGGSDFVEAVQRAWDDDDAVLAVDQRLPSAARGALLDAARPHVVISRPDGPAGPAAPVRRVTDRRAPLLGPGDALVVATSGSTGTPTLVVHTAAGLATHARAVHQRLEVDPDTDRWLVCLPLNHLGGFGVLSRALLTATPFDVVPSPETTLVATAPRRFGSTLVSLVPTVLDRIDAAPYRRVVLGGSRDDTDRPSNVVRTYGSTETGGGVVYDGTPLDGVEVRVDHQAAIAIRSPTNARGARLPDGTVTALTDDDGWMATGDLGRWSDDGRLRVDGRAGDLIITGGENVWPGPVEATLGRHPAVAEVAVLGRPHATWGEEVVAVVVPVDRHRPPTLAQLRTLAGDDLAPYAAPRSLVLVDALPRTSLGKVRRQAVATAIAPS